MLKGKIGKVTAINGATGEYLVMLDSKNERCKESQLSQVEAKAKAPKKKDIQRKALPKEKKSSL